MRISETVRRLYMYGGKQPLLRCGKRRTEFMMLMKDFLLYIYIETMLMRHLAPPTTLGTEEWRALLSSRSLG